MAKKKNFFNDISTKSREMTTLIQFSLRHCLSIKQRWQALGGIDSYSIILAVTNAVKWQFSSLEWICRISQRLQKVPSGPRSQSQAKSARDDNLTVEKVFFSLRNFSFSHFLQPEILTQSDGMLSRAQVSSPFFFFAALAHLFLTIFHFVNENWIYFRFVKVCNDFISRGNKCSAVVEFVDRWWGEMENALRKLDWIGEKRGKCEADNRENVKNFNSNKAEDEDVPSFTPWNCCCLDIACFHNSKSPCRLRSSMISSSFRIIIFDEKAAWKKGAHAQNSAHKKLLMRELKGDPENEEKLFILTMKIKRSFLNASNEQIMLIWAGERVRKNSRRFTCFLPRNKSGLTARLERKTR